MSLDHYASCPCGSGKKLKFCCSDLIGEMEKIQRMLEGNQRAACLEHVRSLRAKHADRASPRGRIPGNRLGCFPLLTAGRCRLCPVVLRTSIQWTCPRFLPRATKAVQAWILVMSNTRHGPTKLGMRAIVHPWPEHRIPIEQAGQLDSHVGRACLVCRDPLVINAPDSGEHRREIEVPDGNYDTGI